jgi:Tol biopolymer transport system component
VADGPARVGSKPAISPVQTARLAALLLFAAAIPARAQFVVRTWLPWRTIETRHFEFHYPLPLEAWTRHVAERADAIDSAVALVVGYAPHEKTQVVVDNPYSLANGSAWPFLKRPTINLWATPPDPRDDIGEFRDWGEMLVSHEFGHIAHLSRPTRSRGFVDNLRRALPVDAGPIAIRAPRWVIEGYATFIEGRVTGSGRPHGVWRPALLRQLALEGQLPRYENLNASGAFEGGAFAYLAGSAFLEWLADQRGDSSLIFVWRRLSARENRSFDDAFRGVFGESPAALYGRFTADLTGKALAARAAIDVAGADTGSIVQRLAWYTGDPAISPDGKRVAIVLRSQILPSRVVVWATAAEPDTGRARRDSILLARDPADVPARPIYPPPKRVLASLRSHAGSPYDSPRFLRDGRMLLSRNTPRGDGSLVPDLYMWDIQRSSVHRVTRGAGITHADPLPNGRAAVATRCRTGWCELVTVSLEDGSIRVIAGGSPEESFFRPRVSPDGSRVVVSVHTREGWRLRVVDLATRASSPVAALEHVDAYDAAWRDSTSLVATTNATGVPQLERVNLATRERLQLTDVTGAAVAGEPSPSDSSVWFLSLYSRGYDVRRVRWSSTLPVAQPIVSALIPAAAVAPAAVPAFAMTTPSSPRPFGLAPRLFLWIPVPRADADGAGGGLALSSRDLIGRSAVTVQGMLGDPALWRGASATAEWLGTRPGIRFDAFGATQRTSALANDLDSIRFDARLVGGDAMLDQLLAYDAWAMRYRVGGSVASLRLSDPNTEIVPSVTTTRAIGFADVGITALQRGDAATLTETVGARGTLGTAFDAPVHRIVATAALSLAGRGVIPLSVSSTYGRTNLDAPVYEQLAIGGGPVALMPSIVLSQRLPMPVLPSAIIIGSSAFTYRASVDSRPLALYLWGGSTAPAGESFTRWQRVVGAEWTQSLASIPMAGTPPLRAQIGVGESLDAPVRHRVRVYAGLVLDP